MSCQPGGDEPASWGGVVDPRFNRLIEDTGRMKLQVAVVLSDRSQVAYFLLDQNSCGWCNTFVMPPVPIKRVSALQHFY